MGVIGLTAAKLVSLGICLGIGFWASKKLTNVADYYLILWDEQRKAKKQLRTQTQKG